jgi:threonine/homoserine/homoserine lactone efflux protein
MQNGLAGLVASAAALGFWAGISPGPLLALVITETLRHGPGAGARVALSPLVTDLPIIVVTTLALAGMARADAALGAVSLAGAALLAWLAWEAFRAGPPEVDGAAGAARSLRKGVVTNLLNPHPYLFWLTVGAPLLLSAHAASGPLGPALYLAAFYVMIVAAKLGVALLTARSRRFLTGPAYRWLMRAMGLALLWFAVSFAHKGLELLGL